MAGTRRVAGVERRAALGAVARGVSTAALAVALWMAVSRLWPVEWEGTHDDTRDRILLFGGGGLATLAAWHFAAGGLHVCRWRVARRWERMLSDPASAHLVPPLESHVKPVARSSAWKLRGTALLGAIAAVAIVGYVGVAVAERVSGDGSFDAPDGSPQLLMVAAFAGWVAIGSWRVANRRRLAARLEQVSNDGPGRAQVVPPASTELTATAIPELRVIFQTSAARQPPGIGRAIAADRALHVLYLRLFANEAGTNRFLEGQWRRHAYVHLLRSAEQVTPEEVEEAKDTRTIASLFISTPEELESALTRQATGRYDEPMPSGVLARWRWMRNRERGRYPVRALLCHGSFWKQAIDLLLPRMDHVVLDLTGYRPEHAGTRYELQRIIDRYPIERVAILGGPGADRPFLTAQIQWAWRGMAAGSPNEGTGLRAVSVWLSRA